MHKGIFTTGPAGRLILFFMRLPDRCWGNKKSRAVHRTENDIAWKKYLNNNPRGYIENQDPELKVFKIGNFTADYNGCSAVAVFNCLKRIGADTAIHSLPDIIQRLEECGLILGGKFGISLHSVERLLKGIEGINTQVLINPVHNKKLYNPMWAGDACIICLINDHRHIGKGLHYISATRENGGRYCIHNYRPLGGADFDSLPSVMESLIALRAWPLGVILLK